MPRAGAEAGSGVEDPFWKDHGSGSKEEKAGELQGWHCWWTVGGGLGQGSVRVPYSVWACDPVCAGGVNESTNPEAGLGASQRRDSLSLGFPTCKTAPAPQGCVRASEIMS